MTASRYDRPRRHERLVPERQVRVEAEAASIGVIRGEARNLSEGGACVALDTSLEVGEELIMKLLFAGYDNPVSATGRVVWSAPSGRDEAHCGIQWTHAGPQRRWIGWLVKT